MRCRSGKAVESSSMAIKVILGVYKTRVYE